VAIPGVPLALVAGGAVLVYSGVENRPVADIFRGLARGQAPAPGPGGAVATLTSPAGGTITSQGGQPAGSGAANQALGRVLAAPYGWAAGAEWTALNNIAMAESGWSDTVVNPASGAAGIAQNIAGFGPGYESGNATQQIMWLLAYIKSRYGDPIAAWQFHLANGYY
jgi:colicin import membrane protein